MSAMKPYRELNDEELEARIRELRESLFVMRVHNTTRELTNYANLARDRRELARALTARNERRPAQAAARSRE